MLEGHSYAACALRAHVEELRVQGRFDVWLVRRLEIARENGVTVVNGVLLYHEKPAKRTGGGARPPLSAEAACEGLAVIVGAPLPSAGVARACGEVLDDGRWRCRACKGVFAAGDVEFHPFKCDTSNWAVTHEHDELSRALARFAGGGGPDPHGAAPGAFHARG